MTRSYVLYYTSSLLRQTSRTCLTCADRARRCRDQFRSPASRGLIQCRSQVDGNISIGSHCFETESFEVFEIFFRLLNGALQFFLTCR